MTRLPLQDPRRRPARVPRPPARLPPARRSWPASTRAHATLAVA